MEDNRANDAAIDFGFEEFLDASIVRVAPVDETVLWRELPLAVPKILKLFSFWQVGVTDGDSARFIGVDRQKLFYSAFS